LPVLARCSRKMSLKNVDLPDPDAPTKKTNSPFRCRHRCCRALPALTVVRLGYILETNHAELPPIDSSDALRTPDGQDRV
jgi:hypothetical protein